ncbi:sodium-coupled monocarboxylate transporter 2-like isoform X2 [Pomacea canaliculata]|uniref:sodium-coupled monocarboxylate transporter 2-like isoform X2 n=1 Tax=Pomacea canaliculata TaxID=400727 RepID=UPI000D728AC5|nr:sodium-coupled monocarboxylate transporter 2-like isoform X2 [Pomacea canaliculata]
MAMALFSPGIALQTATGLPLWVSIAILGGICTLYTAVGGIKSVVWTDVFQTGVYVIGVGTVIVMCTLHVGSLTQAFRLASEGGRIEFNQISPDVRERHSLWATLIGGCFTLFTGFTQSSAQRISSLKTLKKAKLAFLLNAPINLLNECILTVTGVLLYAYVVTIGCDPYQAGIIDNRNQMMPYFVPSLLGSLPGMPGLYISMLFSGALSTLSSGINSLGANTVEDLLARPLRGYKDATVTVIAKISVLLFGALGIGLAYLARSLRGPVTQITSTIVGACNGPINGIFFMAGMVPWANKYGAVGGGLIGIAVNLWITVGSLLYGAPTLALPPGPTHNCSGNNSYSFSFYNLSTDTNPNSNITNLFHSQRADTFSIYDISYLWIAVIGFFVTLSTGIIISFITGSTNKATLNPKLVFPFTRKLFRMKEPSQEAEDSSDVLVMKTYQNPAEKCIGNTDTMDEDHLSVQPLM